MLLRCSVVDLPATTGSVTGSVAGVVTAGSATFEVSMQLYYQLRRPRIGEKRSSIA